MTNFKQISIGSDEYYSELELRQKQRQRAVKDFLYKTYLQMVRDNPQDFISQLGETDEVVQYIQSVDKQKFAPYAFITLNFGTDGTFEKNIQAIHALLLRREKYIKAMAYSYEFYTSTGGHPHIHILVSLDRGVKTTIYKSTLIQRFYRKFRKFLTDTNSVDVRMRNTFESAISYLLGKKKTPQKCELAIKDQEWRKKLGLPPPDVSQFPKLES